MTKEETMIMALSERVNSLAEHVLCIWNKVDALEKRAGIYTDTYKGTSITAEREPTFDDAHHCGQDTGKCKVSCGNLEATVPCKNLLGMQVVRTDVPCDVCAMDTDDCVKVELVGGGYICLAKPQQEEQEDERPVISFDEEEQQQEETTRTIMDGIREQTQAFMDYLDSVVKG